RRYPTARENILRTCSRRVKCPAEATWRSSEHRTNFPPSEHLLLPGQRMPDSAPIFRKAFSIFSSLQNPSLSPEQIHLRISTCRDYGTMNIPFHSARRSFIHTIRLRFLIPFPSEER